MCFFNTGSSTKNLPVKAPPVKPAPTQAQVEADAAAEAAKNTVTEINTDKKIVAKRQGTYGNLKTHGHAAFGDVGYGANAVARFGALGE